MSAVLLALHNHAAMLAVSSLLCVCGTKYNIFLLYNVFLTVKATSSLLLSSEDLAFGLNLCSYFFLLLIILLLAPLSTGFCLLPYYSIAGLRDDFMN